MNENNYRRFLVSLLCVLSVNSNAEVISRNNEWVPSRNGEVPGWLLHRCVRVVDKEGRAVMRMPIPHDTSFAKLAQRIALKDPSILALRVSATVRAWNPDPAQDASRKPGPNLRIYYHQAGTDWSFKEVLWPAGREGSGATVPYQEGWQTLSFELPRPAGAEHVEVAVEVPDQAFGVEVGDLRLTAIRSDAALGRPAEAEPVPPEQRINLLEGFSTRFEGGSAGWQVFLLPHYPAVQLTPDFVGGQAGEGKTSIRIPPGAGLNSMPVPAVKPGEARTLSFLVRGDHETELVVRQGYDHKSLRDVRVPVTREWTRVHASFEAADNQNAPFYFIENRPGDGDDTNVYIDAVSLNPGSITEYISPEAELVLVSQPDGSVRADLQLAEDMETPGAWTWTLEEVAIDSRLLGHGPVVWIPKGPQRFSATFEHPREHGLYRLVVMREDDRSIAPMQELLIARAPFTGLPEFKDGGAPVSLGGHAHHNWARQGSPPRTLHYHPDWEGFLRSLRTMGLEWMRFHGGRANPTLLSFAAPDGPREDYLLALEHLEPYRNAGFRLMAVLELGFGKMFRREPWFPARDTHGEWAVNAMPDDMSIWTDFVRGMATAYADVFDAWEIMNEPNGSMPAADYMTLLTSAYTILKEVLPDSPVLGISATADYESSIGGFIEQCFALGAADAMDILSFHPYVGNDTPEASLRLMQNTARILENSAADKGLWNSEVGWSTTPAYISHEALAPIARDGAMGSVGVSAVLGAAYTTRNILHSSRVGVKHYFIWSGMNPQFAWQAKGHFSPPFEYDGTKSPLYFSVGTLQRVLQDATFREAIELRDGGLWAYLYDFPDERVLAAIWTNERREANDLRAAGLSHMPARGWDGMGRPLDLSSQAIDAGPMPGYYMWDNADVEDIAAMIHDLTWETVPRFSLRVGPAMDGAPRFELHASNPLSTPVPSLWVRDNVAPLRQEIPAGSETVLATGIQATPQTHATLNGTIKIGATGLTRIQQRNRFHFLTISPLPLDEGSALVLSNPAHITFGVLPEGFLEANPIRLWLHATAEGLHIAFEVPKPEKTFMQSEVGPSQINMDSVEIFLRARADAVNWNGGGYQRGDIKFSIAQDHRNPEIKSVQVDHGGDAIHPKDIQFAFAARNGKPGYTGTVFLPWSALPMLNGAPPSTLGFDISFNQSETAGRRQAQITWSGPGSNWLDPSGFGVLRILPAEAQEGGRD